MKIYTKKHAIDTVVERWHSQYGTRSPDITERLRNLETKSEDSIAEVIGNRSWTRNRCDECGEDVQSTIQLGQEPDYDSSTVNICGSCLQRAVELINKEGES